MNVAPVSGTRYSFPQESVTRLTVIARLQALFRSWGYDPVEVPALELYDPAHPAAAKSFKLSDTSGNVLALRADFTPAIAKLVKLHYPELADSQGAPRRFQYCGTLWQAIDPDIARTREFTQLGLELVGVSNARADAELVHLAREAVREVGLAPRVEIGYPGFVQALFELAEIPEGLRAQLAALIDRKEVRTLEALLSPLALASDLRRALLTTPDLYGEVSVIDEARALAPWPAAQAKLDRLEAILAEFEDSSELLLDFGMVRRLRYYTGITFRAYTFDFGQPLLGGGRYDGALLTHAAGFALGLERLLTALPAKPDVQAPQVLSLNDPLARRLRAHGLVVERALDADAAQARRYATARGIPYLLDEKGRLEPLVQDPPGLAQLEALLAEGQP
jgi:ATP phosphoribosyltransferase regulatory subunit